MIDSRLYRAAFMPVAAAVVALMFTVEPVPKPLEQSETASTFETRDTAAIAREIVELAPERPAGSEGDDAVADLVEERFRGLGAGVVSEQRFSAKIGGEEAELRNVVLTLPGESDQALLILASRDSAVGSGAASSAAATAVVIELAERLAGSRHQRTLILASTDGGSEGSIGARELVSALADPGEIEAAIVISQPGARRRHPPFVIASSDGTQSTSSQLVETAGEIITEQARRDPGLPGPFGDLARLAIPSGLGDQAVLIETGVAALALSSAGEAPLPAAEDGPGDLSSASLAQVGRTALSLTLALDAARRAPEHGPGAYLRTSGNLIPGWAVGFLALTLLLPATLTAIDATFRAARRRERVGTGLGWVATRGAVFLAPLLLAYALALVGLIPRPRFPFDPSRYTTDGGEAVALASLVAAFALVGLAIRPLRSPERPAPQTLAAAAGVFASVAALGIWAQNPYLGLLLAPTAHVWLLGARAEGPTRTLPTAAVIAAALAPLALAAIYVTEQLGLGLAAPWRIVLMVVDGQIPPGIAALGCLIAGSLVASLALARKAAPATPPPEVSVRGPITYAGPGSLGGTDSALPKR